MAPSKSTWSTELDNLLLRVVSVKRKTQNVIPWDEVATIVSHGLLSGASCCGRHTYLMTATKELIDAMELTIPIQDTFAEPGNINVSPQRRRFHAGHNRAIPNAPSGSANPTAINCEALDDPNLQKHIASERDITKIPKASRNSKQETSSKKGKKKKLNSEKQTEVTKTASARDCEKEKSTDPEEKKVRKRKGKDQEEAYQRVSAGGLEKEKRKKRKRNRKDVEDQAKAGNAEGAEKESSRKAKKGRRCKELHGNFSASKHPSKKRTKKNHDLDNADITVDTRGFYCRKLKVEPDRETTAAEVLNSSNIIDATNITHSTVTDQRRAEQHPFRPTVDTGGCFTQELNHRSSRKLCVYCGSSGHARVSCQRAEEVTGGSSKVYAQTAAEPATLVLIAPLKKRIAFTLLGANASTVNNLAITTLSVLSEKNDTATFEKDYAPIASHQTMLSSTVRTSHHQRLPGIGREQPHERRNGKVR